MNPVVKRASLMASLLCVSVLAWLSPSGETDDLVANTRIPVKTPLASDVRRVPSPRSAGDASHASTAAVDVLGIVARNADIADDDADGRLFAAVSWKLPEVEKPAAPVARPIEKAVTPALPFVVLGRYDDKGRSVVFLQQGEQNLAVHVGDKIGATYQVESLHGTNMALRYLPTNQLQTLEVGGAQ
jgi:hypothetical protein